ncbi:MAG TPA: AraC family transcriptional regulator [Streptosporangiaceae bacterium]|nr:AraC family transcriptional regulator [Streptosporangiaceae bacterium]
MVDNKPPSAVLPVERDELVTKDMHLLADLLGRLYVEHAALFRCDDPAQVDGEVRSATVGGLKAGLLRYGRFDYDAVTEPADAPTAVTVTHGSGTIAVAGEEHCWARGGAFMLPSDLPSTVVQYDAGFALLRVPWPVTWSLAEERTSLPAADLRFESTAPISAERQAMWASTAKFVCAELVSSGSTQISPLMAHELTRMAATVMLETFPNTAMTAMYVAGPGWTPPAAVRRAAAFIEAHADQPVTLADIAAAAGVTGRALQTAFRRYYDNTPVGYLRHARLERAYTELQDADPATGVTVAAVARRWGWTSPSQFTAAYRRRFGEAPSRTLRT